VAAACSYLAAKPTADVSSPRSVVNVYAYLESLGSVFVTDEDLQRKQDSSAADHYVSEGVYFDRTARLMKVESAVLRVLGFQTQVAVPHALCINYLQALDVLSHERAGDLARRAFAHLNSALCSPQLRYLTHQPNALATAAVYLAAREVGVKLPGEQWWEVFDCDREELGFLVVALLSIEGFVRAEQQKWEGAGLPLSLEAMKAELSRRQATED
jgi:hypothetical protein